MYKYCKNSLCIAHDATEMVAQLRAQHFTSQTVEGKEGLKTTGLNLIDGSIRGMYS